MTVVETSAGRFEVRIKRKRALEPLGFKRGEYTFTVDTKEQGKAEEQKIYKMIDSGTIPHFILNKAQEIRQGGITVGDMWEIMITDKHYPITASKDDLVTQLMPKFKDVVITKYSKQDLLTWLDDMKGEHLSPGTIRKKIGAMRAIFTYALKNSEGTITHNVFDDLQSGYSEYNHYHVAKDSTRSEHRTRRLQSGEYERIIKVIDAADIDPRMKSIEDIYRPAWRLLFEWAVHSAMRMQEMYLTQWIHVDLEGGYINIPAANAKGREGKRKARQVPISPELLREFKLYKAKFGGDKQNAYVLPFFKYYGCNKKNCTTSLSHAWAKIAESACCVDLRFHDLRHEGVSRFVERTTYDIYDLMQFTGHADMRTFGIYNQMRAELLNRGGFITQG